MTNTTVHIIEPTLASQAGHCYGYCQSLINVDPELNLELWVNHQGLSLFNHKAVKCHGIFRRRLRKVQQYFLYKRLLKTHDTLFIPTAGRTDMLMLDRLLKKHRSNARIVLHFHQFSRSDKKLALLKKLANRHHNWVILTPTQRLLNTFIQAGFKHCHAVACPGYTPLPHAKATHFQYALYAGAARADKGFAHVVTAIKQCQHQSISIPFRMQTSAPESGRYDDSSQLALKELNTLRYAKLIAVNHTLDQQHYLQQYSGSICLQAYDTDCYHDKFSAVSLDAICAGAPIITGAGTWIADTVEQFNAGIIVNDYKPDTLISAMQTIIDNYAQYQQNCFAASKKLAELHHPKHTLALLK